MWGPLPILIAHLSLPAELSWGIVLVVAGLALGLRALIVRPAPREIRPEEVTDLSPRLGARVVLPLVLFVVGAALMVHRCGLTDAETWLAGRSGAL